MAYELSFNPTLLLHFNPMECKFGLHLKMVKSMDFDTSNFTMNISFTRQKCQCIFLPKLALPQTTGKAFLFIWATLEGL